ncbi:hypothetical protein P9112_007638 [Eukaryota sp. TZLM1-RC]
MRLLTVFLVTVLLAAHCNAYRRALFYSNHGCGLKRWPAAQEFKDDHLSLYPDLSSFPNTVHPRFEFFEDGVLYKVVDIEEYTTLDEILSLLTAEAIYKHSDPRYEPLVQ